MLCVTAKEANYLPGLPSWSKRYLLKYVRGNFSSGFSERNNISVSRQLFISEITGLKKEMKGDVICLYCEMRFIYFGRLILSFFFSESFCYKFEILQKNARLSKAVYGILKCFFGFFYYQCTILISRSQQYRVNQ